MGLKSRRLTDSTARNLSEARRRIASRNRKSDCELVNIRDENPTNLVFNEGLSDEHVRSSDEQFTLTPNKEEAKEVVKEKAEVERKGSETKKRSPDRNKSSKKTTIEKRLFETFLILGEVSLENENYPQAVDDLTICLEKQKVN